MATFTLSFLHQPSLFLGSQPNPRLTRLKPNSSTKWSSKISLYFNSYLSLLLKQVICYPITNETIHFFLIKKQYILKMRIKQYNSMWWAFNLDWALEWRPDYMAQEFQVVSLELTNLFFYIFSIFNWHELWLKIQWDIQTWINSINPYNNVWVLWLLFFFNYYWLK